MDRVLTREKIVLDCCQLYQKEHNGCSERFYLDLEEKISVNLLSAKMPFLFWGHALGYTIHVHNQTLNSLINFKTPFEMFHSYKQKIEHISRFGSVACVCTITRQKESFENEENWVS